MGTRRPNGQGSIFLRGDGRWGVQISVEGRRYSGYAKSREAAEALLPDLRLQALGGDARAHMKRENARLRKENRELRAELERLRRVPTTISGQ